jgi:hypothetical protein
MRVSPLKGRPTNLRPRRHLEGMTYKPSSAWRANLRARWRIEGATYEPPRLAASCRRFLGGFHALKPAGFARASEEVEFARLFSQSENDGFICELPVAKRQKNLDSQGEVELIGSVHERNPIFHFRETLFLSCENSRSRGGLRRWAAWKTNSLHEDKRGPYDRVGWSLLEVFQEEEL